MTTLGTETHHVARTHAIVIASLIPRPVLPHSQLLLPHSTPRQFPGCSQHAQHKKAGQDLSRSTAYHTAGHQQLTVVNILTYQLQLSILENTYVLSCSEKTNWNRVYGTLKYTSEGTQLMSFTSTAAPNA